MKRGREAERGPASRIAIWQRCVAFHLSAATLFAVTVEWWHYRELWVRTPLAPRELLAVLWVLAFKTSLLLLPALAAAALLVWAGRRSTAIALLVASWGFGLLWLAIDVGSQRIFGAHLSHYAPYLLDVFRSGDSLASGFGGDPRAFLLGGTPLVLGALAITATAWRASALASRMPVTLAAGVMAVHLAGVVPVQSTVTRTAVLRRVHEALPIDVGATRAMAARLGGWLEAPPTVRVVSLHPNPRGGDDFDQLIALHNFSAERVGLDGWWLQNRKGTRLPLDGVLGPREGRVIRVRAATFELGDTGDSVTLYDAGGRMRHEVGYVRAQAHGGQVINFRDEEDFDGFSRHMNELLVPVARRIQPVWRREKPADAQALPPADGRRPDVVLIVFEGPQHTLFSPDGLPRLDEWARGGLRLTRHYSQSNISHYGLYGILYGRRPLFYDRDLDDRIPPQLAATLKASGYDTTFLAMGFDGWRRMGEMVNEPNFDHVPGSGEWRGEGSDAWPSYDRWMFEEIRTRLATPHEKPQLIVGFALSSHYPYQFPPEFEVHTPVGIGVSWDNWTKLSSPELRNRYRNSSLFLEDEVMKTIASVDPAKTIVIVTGDHGESLGEDGGLTHGSKPSDIQLRVPFAMVGPGVPARTIDTATSHLDVLPTLFHVLAGSPVEVQGASGRDVLDEALTLEDRVLLAPRQGRQPYELLLVRESERLLFKVRLDRPSLQTFGFLDANGDMELETSVPPDPEEAVEWVDALREELERDLR